MRKWITGNRPYVNNFPQTPEAGRSQDMVESIAREDTDTHIHTCRHTHNRKRTLEGSGA